MRLSVVAGLFAGEMLLLSIPAAVGVDAGASTTASAVGAHASTFMRVLVLRGPVGTFLESLTRPGTVRPPPLQPFIQLWCLLGERRRSWKERNVEASVRTIMSASPRAHF
jgi:hypothetical protein